MALRFFSYSMGFNDIDAAILDRPPANELLEKLRQYQRVWFLCVHVLPTPYRRVALIDVTISLDYFGYVVQR